MLNFLKIISEMLQSFIGSVNDYLSMTNISQTTLSRFISLLNQILTYNNLAFIFNAIAVMIGLSVLFVVIDIMRDLL